MLVEGGIAKQSRYATREIVKSNRPVTGIPGRCGFRDEEKRAQLCCPERFAAGHRSPVSQKESFGKSLGLA